MRFFDSHFVKAVLEAIEIELKVSKPLCLEMMWKCLYISDRDGPIGSEFRHNMIMSAVTCME